MNKICLIIDPSAPFLHNEVKRVMNEWNDNKKSELVHVTEWKFGTSLTSTSLFNDCPFIHLNLQNNKDLSAFAELIKNDKNKLFTGNWYGSGLIITATTSRGTTAIEKIITNAKGKIYKKRKPQEIKDELLNRTHISTSIKQVLSSHVGEDYDMLISFINEISKLPIEEQKLLELNEVLTMIPMRPGSILPWEFIDYVIKGDSFNAIQAVKRTLENSHPLVLMILLKRKLDMSFRIKALKEDNIRTNADLALKLNVKNGPELWGASTMANNLTMNTLEYIVKIVSKAERDIKGGSNINVGIIFEILITKITLAIKYNKPIERLE